MSQAQEVFQVLQEIDKLLADIELKIQRIEGSTGTGMIGAGGGRLGNAVRVFRSFERIAVRWLALAEKTGLDPNVNRAIQQISAITVKIYMYVQAVNMLLSANPLTMAIGIPSTILTAMSFGSIMEGY